MGKQSAIHGSVDARAFTARLKVLKRAADTEGYRSIPILACCAIEFDGIGATMKLSHYGLDATVSARVEADGTGSACVPMNTLLAFLSAADGDTVTIAKADDDDAVRFTCGRYSIDLVPLAIGDVPRLETPDVFSRGFALEEGVLAGLFALTTPFISTEETRYYLNGVCFELDADTVRVVATDGHKLGTRETKTPAPLEAWPDYKPIVPRLAVAAISNCIGRDQCTVRFNAVKDPDGWKRQIVQVSSADWTVTAKLIDGNFPDWRRVIPKGTPDTITIKMHAGDLKRIGAIGKAISNNALKLAFKHEEFVVASISDMKHADVSVRADIRADVSGEFSTFGVNHQYLKTIANAFGSNWVEMNYDDSSSPFLMRGENSPEGEFAVLMPMRV